MAMPRLRTRSVGLTCPCLVCLRPIEVGELVDGRKEGEMDGWMDEGMKGRDE